MTAQLTRNPNHTHTYTQENDHVGFPLFPPISVTAKNRWRFLADFFPSVSVIDTLDPTKSRG